MPSDFGPKRPSDMSLMPMAKKSRMDVMEYDASGPKPKRTSSLLSPIMLLEGHAAEILCARFSPKGDVLASAGSERCVYLWQTYGECDSAIMQPPHGGTICDLRFNFDGTALYTASVDKTVGVWDVSTGSRIKRLKGHTNFVNAVGEAKTGPPLVVSGSDDAQVRVWDIRRRGSVVNLNSVYQVTAVSFGESAQQIVSGGIDNEIKVWDLRKAEIAFTLKGHTDTITCLDLSPDGSYVLSNSMDGTMRIWDIRPFAPRERCMKVFQGHSHGFEKYLLKCAWSKDGQRVASGSSDRYVYVWDSNSRQIQYQLPGHEGSVVGVDFHPDEPI
ncbi:U5 small nuclear ribonucleoprotein 40 kDa protein, partial [Orchesella cincta]